MYELKITSDTDEKVWRESVTSILEFQGTHKKNGELPLFFDWRWRKIIKKAFSHRPLYLILQNTHNEPEAVCPLFLVKSSLFGASLISLPYLNGGGILSKSDSATLKLLEEIHTLCKQYSCDYVELRSRLPISNEISLPTRTHKAAMLLPLLQDPEEMFSIFPPKLRSQIRRPTKEGCYASIYRGSEITHAQIQSFYSVFSTHMRDLGTPVFPKKLFTETLTQFGKDAKLCVVYQNNIPIAAGITIQNGIYVEIPWASSLKSKKKFAPNMLLYWEIIKDASLSGARYFDFGRSTYGSGPFKFKQQWGATPEKLHWYYPISESEIPDVNPDSKKFAFLVSVWRRLPLCIANTIGPLVTRSLP